MKQFLLILAISLLLVGCKTTKKTVNSDIKTVQNIKTTEQVKTAEALTVNANKIVETWAALQNDVSTDIKTVSKTTEYYPPAAGQGKGAVKSETITTTEKADRDKSKAEAKATQTDKSTTEATKETESKVASEEDTKIEAETTVKEKSKPGKWIWWVFGAGAVAGVVVMWKWRQIKSVLSVFFGKIKI